MADVSAKDVASLRRETGAGMMDAKRALAESGGDRDAAKRWLREQGLAQAGKRAGRAANEGAVEVAAGEHVGAIVELTAETDFVAKSADFRALLTEITALVLEEDGEGLEARPLRDSTVGDVVKETAGRLGENVALGRVVRFETDGLLDSYQHDQAGRGVIGVLVELGGVDTGDVRARELAHDVALHIASAAPRFLARSDVPEKVVAAEREVLENLTRNEGKPEQAIPKIVDGRMNGWYKEHVLLDQGFVREPKRPVSDLLAELGAEAVVRRFARVKIGEE